MLATKKCKVDSCDKFRDGRSSMCGMHRSRWNTYKSHDLPPRRSRTKKQFLIDQSPEVVKICKYHGSLTRSQTKNYVGKHCRIDGTIATWDNYICLECDIIKTRKSSLMRSFGITPEDYDKMLSDQNNACAICKKLHLSPDPRTGTMRRLAVDHNHDTKKIRGLLCVQCNTAFGSFKESIEILQSAIEYAMAYQ